MRLAALVDALDNEERLRTTSLSREERGRLVEARDGVRARPQAAAREGAFS